MKKVLLVLSMVALTFSMNAQIDYSESIKILKIARDVNIEQLKIEKDTELIAILKSQIKQYEIMIEGFGGTITSNPKERVEYRDVISIQENAENRLREKYNTSLAKGEEVAIADLPMKEWRQYLKEYNLIN